jgi:hypothetical protein
MTCTGRAFDLAQKFVGTWEEYTVTPEGETLVGTLQVAWELNNCVLTQHFESAGGDFRFLAFGYFDSNNQAWQETYILSHGRVAHYRWEEIGDEILVNRVGGNPNDLRRLRIKDLTEIAYDVAEEKSINGGETWEAIEFTRTKRVNI